LSVADDDRCAGSSLGLVSPASGAVVASCRSALQDSEPLGRGVAALAGASDPVPQAKVGALTEVGGGRLSLEVRWVFNGGLPAAMIEWLGPFRAAAEERVDCYLVAPRLPGISLKIRDATLLDVKVAQGGAGILGLRHGGRGRLQTWEKLSFPFDATAPRSIDGSRWVSVEKIRRRRSFTSVAGHAVERPLSDIESPGCTVELTEVHVGGDVAWTLAFEARGASSELNGYLRTTTSHLLHDAPPVGVKLGLRESMSYMRWLRSPEIRRHVSGLLGIRRPSGCADGAHADGIKPAVARPPHIHAVPRGESAVDANGHGSSGVASSDRDEDRHPRRI
jgi:hypothetical protein